MIRNLQFKEDHDGGHFQSRNQSSVISSEIDAMAVHLASHLRGRLLDLSLTVQPDGVVIGGRTGSYYVKQLAQHAVMNGVSMPIAANDIEVLEAPRGRDACIAIAFQKWREAFPTRLLVTLAGQSRRLSHVHGSHLYD